MTDAKKLTLLDIYELYNKRTVKADNKLARMLGIVQIGWALGKRSYNKIQPKEEYHNLYLLNIGKSSSARKTTTQNFFDKFYPYDAIIFNDGSPEKYLESLGERPDGVASLGEFSKYLKGIKNPNYLSTFTETWNDMYRWDGMYTKKLVKCTYTISNPYPVIVSSCTEEVLEENVNREMMTGGFFTRFILNKVGDAECGRGRLSPDVGSVEQIIKERIRTLYNSGVAFIFEFDDEALTLLNQEEARLKESTTISSIAARYSSLIIPIADILYMSEWLMDDNHYNWLHERAVERTNKSNISNVCNNSSNCNNSNDSNDSNDSNTCNTHTYMGDCVYTSNISIITIFYLQQAVTIVEDFIKTAEELYKVIDVDPDVVKSEKIIRERGPIKKSDLCSYAKLTAKQTDKVLATLGENYQDKFVIIKYRKVRANGTKIKVGTTVCWKGNHNTEKCSNCKLKELCSKTIEDGERIIECDTNGKVIGLC